MLSQPSRPLPLSTEYPGSQCRTIETTSTHVVDNAHQVYTHFNEIWATIAAQCTHGTLSFLDWKAKLTIFETYNATSTSSKKERHVHFT